MTADKLQQDELLAILSEECGEVVQIIGKISRHGLWSCHPSSETPNKESLEKELGDILLAIDLLEKYGIVDKRTVEHYSYLKREKISNYLHHVEV